MSNEKSNLRIDEVRELLNKILETHYLGEIFEDLIVRFGYDYVLNQLDGANLRVETMMEDEPDETC